MAVPRVGCLLAVIGAPGQPVRRPEPRITEVGEPEPEPERPVLLWPHQLPMQQVGGTVEHSHAHSGGLP